MGKKAVFYVGKSVETGSEGAGIQAAISGRVEMVNIG